MHHFLTVSTSVISLVIEGLTLSRSDFRLLLMVGVYRIFLKADLSLALCFVTRASKIIHHLSICLSKAHLLETRILQVNYTALLLLNKFTDLSEHVALCKVLKTNCILEWLDLTCCGLTAAAIPPVVTVVQVDLAP